MTYYVPVVWVIVAAAIAFLVGVAFMRYVAQQAIDDGLAEREPHIPTDPYVLELRERLRK